MKSKIPLDGKARRVSNEKANTKSSGKKTGNWFKRWGANLLISLKKVLPFHRNHDELSSTNIFQAEERQKLAFLEKIYGKNPIQKIEKLIIEEKDMPNRKKLIFFLEDLAGLGNEEALNTVARLFFILEDREIRGSLLPFFREVLLSGPEKAKKRTFKILEEGLYNLKDKEIKEGVLRELILSASLEDKKAMKILKRAYKKLDDIELRAKIAEFFNDLN